VTSTNESKNVTLKRINQMRRDKIIIKGDIHAKGCASKVQHNLENKYEHSRSSENGIRLGSSNKNKKKKYIEKWTKVIWYVGRHKGWG
jgi:hypothetical protein